MTIFCKIQLKWTGSLKEKKLLKALAKSSWKKVLYIALVVRFMKELFWNERKNGTKKSFSSFVYFNFTCFHPVGGKCIIFLKGLRIIFKISTISHAFLILNIEE